MSFKYDKNFVNVMFAYKGIRGIGTLEYNFFKAMVYNKPPTTFRAKI